MPPSSDLPTTCPPLPFNHLPSHTPPLTSPHSTIMADLRRIPPPRATNAIFLQKLHPHAPLIVAATILLFLSGCTIAALVLGAIFLGPLILISSPIWVPVAAILFLFSASVVGLAGFGVTAGWMYRYVKGMNPPGSGRMDYARRRVVDTAGHVKDYAREYGGYLQSKVKDAAPGA